MAHILSSLVLGELQQMSADRNSDASTWNDVEFLPKSNEFHRYMVLNYCLTWLSLSSCQSSISNFQNKTFNKTASLMAFSCQAVTILAVANANADFPGLDLTTRWDENISRWSGKSALCVDSLLQNNLWNLSVSSQFSTPGRPLPRRFCLLLWKEYRHRVPTRRRLAWLHAGRGVAREAGRRRLEVHTTWMAYFFKILWSGFGSLSEFLSASVWQLLLSSSPPRNIRCWRSWRPGSSRSSVTRKTPLSSYFRAKDWPGKKEPYFLSLENLSLIHCHVEGTIALV